MEGGTMASRYTYKEDIERQRYWVECKIKKELRLVADAIIDKVIWKACDLDVLMLAFPAVAQEIVWQNQCYQEDFPEWAIKKLESRIKKYAKEEALRCYKICERSESR
nr:MAG TPA: hypothetical protein [Caudoviricetes sp.]